MNLPGRPAVAALVLALGSMPALGADDARAQAEQRVRLASRLIADSPAAQRILASGNGLATSHLDEGRLHLSLADEALRAGDYARARKAADDALQHLGMARRLVPDAPSRQQALRARHQEQFAALDRLLEAWRTRAGAQAGGDPALLDATGLGEAQRYEEGLQLLASAQRLVLDGMNRSLVSREIDYTVRPADADEAFRAEMARHAALADLVPLALRELQPNAEARALIERYLQSGRTLQGQAMLRHGGGDARGAVEHLRGASEFVQRALQAAGVMTPGAAGDPP